MTRYGRVVLGVLLALALAGPTSAGTILLSGDTNIINLLVGSFGQPINAGNQQFFQNVLGAGLTVLVLETTGGSLSVDNADGDVNDFYNTLGGVTSSIHSGAVSAGDLAGVDLFVSSLPNAFAQSEIDALSAFLSSGRTVVFTGENSSSDFTASRAAINAALVALGSGMAIVPDNLYAGFNNAEVLVDPFTAGVASFRFAATSRVSGGTVVFNALEFEPFVAYESSRVPAPAPATLFLLGAGLVGVWQRRRLS